MGRQAVRLGMFILLFSFCLINSLKVSADSVLDCSRSKGSFPDPSLGPGSSNLSLPIEHIIVIMQENRSFDEYFGNLNSSGYEGEVDGVTDQMVNFDRNGKPIYAYHETNRCTLNPFHTWDVEHYAWHDGRNDRFVEANETNVMGFYTKNELNYYYALANQFAIADRYFSSVLSQTYPNRFFLYTGTAFGHTLNDTPKSKQEFHQKTIFDVLDEYGITWTYYNGGENYLRNFKPLLKRDQAKFKKIRDYTHDLTHESLAQVSFLESSGFLQDEHPPADVRIGQAWVAHKINALMNSPYWKSSVLFLTYDENGGLFDHVPPPEACAPDEIEPQLGRKNLQGDYRRYGFRVPFVAVSPFTRHHYVSHITYDHTSILKFIETKFNLPALTRRDANADGLLDLFDFNHPQFEVKALPKADWNWGKIIECTAVTGLKTLGKLLKHQRDLTEDLD